MIKDIFVSVVTLLDAGDDLPLPRLRDLQQHLAAHFTDFEIVIIGNRYPETKATLDEAASAEVSGVRYLQLSAPVSLDVAYASGVENTIGDYIVLLDKNDPVDMIDPVVTLIQEKCDIVIGTAETPRSVFYRLFRPFAQKLLRAVGYDLPTGATRMRCLSRRVANAVLLTGRRHHQFFMRIQKTGFACREFAYRQISGANPAPKTLANGIGETARLLVFNSARPLRWMSAIGFMGASTAFFFAFYSLLVNVIKSQVVEGWTSIILFMSILFMLLFVILAFFGEYLGRLLDEIQERDDYAIASESISRVMINPRRINVLQESTGMQDSAVHLGAGERQE